MHNHSCFAMLHYRKYNHKAPLSSLQDFFLKEAAFQYKIAMDIGASPPADLHSAPKVPLARRKRFLLALDIDETLVHSDLVVEQSVPVAGRETQAYDRFLTFPNPNGTSDVYGVRFRPYLMEFINRMSKIYDLAAYTASARDYADAVMDLLDPGRRLFVGVLAREHCLPVGHLNVKNMAVFWGRDALLVDNLIYSFAFHPGQGVPICPFVDDPADVELRDLACLLEEAERFESLEAMVHELMDLRGFYAHLEAAVCNSLEAGKSSAC